MSARKCTWLHAQIQDIAQHGANLGEAKHGCMWHHAHANCRIGAIRPCMHTKHTFAHLRDAFPWHAHANVLCSENWRPAQLTCDTTCLWTLPAMPRRPHHVAACLQLSAPNPDWYWDKTAEPTRDPAWQTDSRAGRQILVSTATLQREKLIGLTNEEVRGRRLFYDDSWGCHALRIAVGLAHKESAICVEVHPRASMPEVIPDLHMHRRTSTSRLAYLAASRSALVPSFSQMLDV